MNVTGETGVRGGGRGGGKERRTSFHPFAQSGKEKSDNTGKSNILMGVLSRHVMDNMNVDS